MADIRGEGSDMEGPFSPARRGASNMSIHAGLDNSSYMNRPSMKQEDHPAHNMPDPEYEGVVNSMQYQSDLNSMSDRSSNNGKGPSNINAASQKYNK